MSLELLRRARLAGYVGGKTAIYELVHELRPKKPRPLVRFEGLPGESRSMILAKSMCIFSTARSAACISSPRV